MVLILSNETDYSTNHVIKWLDYYNVEWFRINESDDISFISLEYFDNKIVQFTIEVNSMPVDILKVRGYWYRRGRLNDAKMRINDKISKNEIIHNNLSQYLNEELNNIINFIHNYLINEKVSINSFLQAKNNKTFYQYIATSVGLNVPNTLICNQKVCLKGFLEKQELEIFITKSINELFAFQVNNSSYFTTTYAIKTSKLADYQNYFSPSLFQKYIDKYLELRIFYLCGKLFSMAIFSQQNNKTKLDFREYDYDCPNRNVPFILPRDIEVKIVKFMNAINMNCGSIDMILTNDNEYIFLEVNPVGQFGMVSVPCNYYLEKEISKELSHATKKNN